MHRSAGRGLSRGIPLAVSGAIHLALLVAALIVGARLAPRIEAMIHAELVSLEADAPPPRSSTPEIKAAPRPKARPVPKPIVPPRLVEAPMPSIAPPARADESPPPPPAPAPAVIETPVEAPRSEVVRAPAAIEGPPVSPDLSRSAPAGGAPPGPARASTGLGAPGETKSSDDLPAGVSMLAAIGRPAGGGGAPGEARGGGSTASRGASDITRTAIPRGGYQVQPRYPASARRQGIQGTTLLRVFVATDGRVADISVERTAGHADLDGAAADAVRRWRFEPARRGDEPVAMWVLLPVEFRLK